ncbi:hypothetical protein [Nonomuraea sp. NPDC050786]|uniref:hypothetical protein n=1 Tax=Nonomuraea sp. NPDC050786 TaxID=3154840 RepID=UPI0034009B08
MIAALDPALKCLAYEGRKRYAGTFELIGRREVDAPNASWQADHSELYFYILTEDGTPAGPSSDCSPPCTRCACRRCPATRPPASPTALARPG